MAERRPSEQLAREAHPRPDSGGDGCLAAIAAPGLVLLAVVCCAGPLLVAALLATGAGAWLAAHGYLLGALALFDIAAAVAWRLQARLSRR